MNHVQAIKFRQQIVMRAPGSLKPAPRNARTHSKKQVRQIANSIERFGFTNPVLVDETGSILAGHGRIAAAKLLGLTEVPVLCIGDLSPSDRKAYLLADNKLALNAGWDQEVLAIELQELIDDNFDIDLTGFPLAEIEAILDGAAEADPAGADPLLDQVIERSGPPVTRPGDIWLLGRHRLLCGDARSAEDYAALMAGEAGGIVFTDPPYNVPIDGHVCGLGQVRHREFAMASGEMSSGQFTEFLARTLANMIQHVRQGAILYVCMCPPSAPMAQI
ncbi:ParB N-terminal domain-containing protein [Novosphingobium aquiterrae]|uniref:ParB N-terminal domain-containing protein n=1 Tax=Novosphingobium aquiterrae TaxID=624388 RepID=A0ABV6PKP9_9SPHN